ncbi:vanin-like protein 1 [Zophobas morio]|uniref:vanin-like protein 1 n=1 Tax=Zophobas morio TaxID=2755281 RepID=UPI003082CF18
MLPIILFSLIIVSVSQASKWDTLSATIAVVEFDPIYSEVLTDDERVQENLRKYTDILNVIVGTNNKTLDMIIFPEGSLRVVPETSVEMATGDNPSYDSKEYPDYMKTLSSMAVNFSTYLVTNIVEKVKCDDASSSDSENCKNTGYYYYNTDVVFDRNGTIISRYHKYNLFGEYAVDRPDEPQIETFETDFGVKFGIFTCFDILFKSPAQPVLNENIDAIVYPTNWHSELPFLTALQSQQMFAYTHEIMLFASGGNRPAASSGGSGVHRSTHDTILHTIVAEGGSKTLIYESVDGTVVAPEVQDVDVLGKEMDAFPLWIDDSLQNFTWTPINTTRSRTFEDKLCHGNDTENPFCCNFNITLTTSEETGTSYSYLLVAFSGLRHYPNISDGGLEICGVIACLNFSISSCGQRFPKYDEIVWPVTFEDITITASFEVNDNKTQFPNTLLSSIRPINANETEWSGKKVEEDGKTVNERTFALKKSQNRLLTFAIYGRDFGQDVFPRDDNGDDNHTGAASSISSTLIMLSCSLVLSLMLHM